MHRDALATYVQKQIVAGEDPQSSLRFLLWCAVALPATSEDAYIPAAPMKAATWVASSSVPGVSATVAAAHC